MKKKKKHVPTHFWKRAWGDCLAILRPIQLFDYLVPRRINHQLSEWVGGYLIFGLMSRTRRKLKGNLQAIGEGRFSRQQVHRLSRETIQNYGKYLIDYLYFPQLTPQNMSRLICSSTGNEHLVKALEQKNGAILLSPHLGHWELGGLYLAMQGHPLTVVSLRTGDREIAEYRDQVRTLHGIRVLYLDPKDSPIQNALVMVNALRNGEVLAMLGDRATGAEKVVVELFHRKYWFPSGPYLLSLITQAPIIPAFVVLEGLYYKLILEEPLYVKQEAGKTREQLIANAALQMAVVFEKYLRLYPNQWYNWYPTWNSP